MAQPIIGTHYQIDTKLGEGGMGTVYRGEDARTGKTVAIKQLKADMARPEMIERFRREGEALRDLNHPNIVKMLDMFEYDDQHYLVMEYVSGGDLAQLIQAEGQIPYQRCVDMAIDLADALTRAHRLDIIHRDLKPANILIDKENILRLTDFGVAHVGSKKRVTNTDAIVGTIDYLPPEAFSGEPFDARGDIWAFGVILFEMLTGQRPFQGDSIVQVIQNITTEAIPDLEALCPTSPIALVDLVYRMLERNPQARMSSVRHVGATLEDILEGRDSTAQVPRFDIELDDVVDTIKNNLPPQDTPFVGREAEIEELVNLLNNPDIRLMTILAPGGMGKTRTAIEVASHFTQPDTATDSIQFSDGVYFVDLAPLTSADGIVSAIATAINLNVEQSNLTQKQEVFAFLQAKQILLVFDNFEHVLDGASIITELQHSAPAVQFIVTSRQRLGLGTETVFHLSGLDFPNWETPEDALNYAAVKLFMNSASRAQPSFELTVDNLDYVARICRLVQGMPLGIVLSAAWLAMLTPAEIADELEQSIDILSDEQGEHPERQQSIRAVMEYSWQMMSVSEQAVFMKLSVFRGGFDREAAQAVADANLRVLMSLVNKSLLKRERDSGRYMIHELLRQYAEEQLSTSGQMSDTRTAHAEHYSHFVDKQVPRLKGEAQLEAIHQIETDYDNCYAGWMWAVKQKNADIIDRMIEGLYLYYMLYIRLEAGFALFSKARDVWDATQPDTPLIAGRLNLRLTGAHDHSDRPQAERSLEIAEQHGNTAEIAFCKGEVGRKWGHANASTVEEREHGVSMMQESLEMFHALGDRYYEAIVLDDIGWAQEYLGGFNARQPYAAESIEIRKASGDMLGYAYALSGYVTRLWQFDPSLAEAQMDEAEQIGLEHNNHILLIRTRVIQGVYYSTQNNDLDKAYEVNSDALARSIRINYEFGRICAQLGLASVIIMMNGDLQEAKHLIDQALPNDDVMFTQFEYFVMGSTAYLSYLPAIGDFEDFERRLQPLIANTTNVEPTRDTLMMVVWTSILLASRGELERAALLAGLSCTHPLVQDVPNHQVYQWPTVIEHHKFLRKELGNDRYDALLEESKSLDLATVFRELGEEFG